MRSRAACFRLVRWTSLAALVVSVFLPAGTVSAAGASTGTGATISFELGQQIPLTVGDAGPQGFVLRDVSGDGLPDLVAIDQFNGGVSILINQGNATFGAPMLLTLEVLPMAVAVADFTGDEVPEIAVADFDGSVSLVRRTDSGGFELNEQIDPGVEFIGITTGDLDGDDDNDMIVLETTDEIVLQENDGNGVFDCFEEDLFDTDGEDPVDIDVGDFNGDEKLDVVVLNRTSEDLSLLLNLGDGVLDEALLFPVAPEPRDLAVGRVNDDDMDDVVVIEFDSLGNDNVTVLLGRSDAGFDRPPKALAEVFASAIALGDFDGDGCQDLISTSEEEDVAPVSYGDCTGRFGPALATAAVGPGRGIAVADLDDDGRDDFMVLHVLGERLRPVLSRLVLPPCAGDCDGDGTVDIGELVTAVNIILENATLEVCTALDSGGDGTATINELVQAVGAVLDGCPGEK